MTIWLFSEDWKNSINVLARMITDFQWRQFIHKGRYAQSVRVARRIWEQPNIPTTKQTPGRHMSHAANSVLTSPSYLHTWIRVGCLSCPGRGNLGNILRTMKTNTITTTNITKPALIIIRMVWLRQAPQFPINDNECPFAMFSNFVETKLILHWPTWSL